MDESLVSLLYRRARADQWPASPAAFAVLVDRSVRRAFDDRTPDRDEVERYLGSLHAEDLGLACACAEGVDAAWDHFVREYRPVLYRAANAIDPSGAAREVADSLYAELFGLGVRDGERQSLFRYFHGRSNLATWLRAVLSQRYVDRVRSVSRLDPLPGEEHAGAIGASPPPPDSSIVRYVEVMQRVVAAAVAALAPKDRLRLRCYYAQDLTLAQTGQLLGEHEATVSRNLARTRRDVRRRAEALLRGENMSDAEIDECFAAVVENPGPFDLAEVLADSPERKKIGHDRSK